MRLALCLSGQPRSYFEAQKYIKKNLLDKYNVDVFAHSWRIPGALEQLTLSEQINFIYEPLYNISDFNLPESINSDMFVSNSSHPANFCTSMFYSIYRANEFRIRYEMQNNMKYDFVIRSRFDFALNKVIDFSSLESGTVYIPKDVEGHSLLNDQFAIADSDAMNQYASTFLNLRKHYSRGVPFCGHAMLEANLDLFKIPVNRIELNHPFVDGKFNIGRHSLVREDMSKWVDTKIWGY
jgi:hypothetical protein